MKKIHIEMEVITPISVGAGNDSEWAPGADFVQKDNMVYVLDIHKAVALGIDVKVLTSLLVKSDEKGICKLLGNNLEKCSKYIFKKPAPTKNSIKSFLRTQLYNLPVVAGSSIKGSVRSILFKHFRAPDENDNLSVFGTMKDGTDFMRFIQFSDIEMSSTILVNSKIFNLWGRGNDWQGGWKHGGTKDGDSHTSSDYYAQGFNTLYECVEPGQKGIGSITLADSVYKMLEHSRYAYISHAEAKHSLMNASASGLFKIINDATKDYLTKEKKFFERYPAQRTDEIISNINDLLSQIPSDNSSCLLKMSAGVGFHSITGDWQYDNYDNTGFWRDGRNIGKKKYKSRKIAEYNGQLQLMGFVRLSTIQEEEIKSKSSKLQKQHEDIIKSILLPLQEREAAEMKSAEEERLRTEAQIAEERRVEKYKLILSEAKKLMDDCRWDEAIVKAEEAAAICGGFTDYMSLIEICEKGKKTALFIKTQEELTAAKFQQPLAEVLKGKTSIGNIIGTTVKWIKVGNDFTEKECQVLIEYLRSMPQKEIKSKAKDLKKAISTEWIDIIFKELNIT